MEFMERVSSGSVLLNFPIVADVPLGAELRQIHELVCGYGKAFRRVWAQLSAQTLQL